MWMTKKQKAEMEKFETALFGKVSNEYREAVSKRNAKKLWKLMTQGGELLWNVDERNLDNWNTQGGEELKDLRAILGSFGKLSAKTKGEVKRLINKTVKRMNKRLAKI